MVSLDEPHISFACHLNCEPHHFTKQIVWLETEGLYLAIKIARGKGINFLFKDNASSPVVVNKVRR